MDQWVSSRSRQPVELDERNRTSQVQILAWSTNYLLEGTTMNERSDETGDVEEAGIKTEETGFGEPRQTDDDVNQAQLDAEAAERARMEKLKAKMLSILDITRAEVEAGTLHGLVIVRANEEHNIASGYALCTDAARPIGQRLQEISMDLSLPPGAVREIKGLIGLLRSLGG
jgi:hypothetical protein